MANGAWRIHFEPTIVFITRTAPAAFTTTVVSPTSPAARPPAGTPAMLRVRVKITDDGKGSPPVAPGAAPIDATLQFVSRRAGASSFTPIADAVGKIAYVKSGTTDVPKFTCGSRKQSGPPGTVVKTEPDFTPSSADAVARSDWVLRLEQHPDHFELPLGGTLPLRLAWDFEANTTELQLAARLLVGGTPVLDETVNPKLQIPLRHPSVDEDLSTTGDQLTLFGVRTAMPASLTRPAIPIGSRRFHVFLDPSVTGFIDSVIGAGQSATVRTLVRTVLQDLGISAPDIVMTGDSTFTAEQTRWATLVTATSGQFHCLNISNLTSIPPNAPTNAQTFLPNRSFAMNGDGSNITFFDFFVGLENTDPPGTELGIGEKISLPNTFNVTAATKRLLTPIILFGGSSSGGIRANLKKVDAADQPNFMANVILHEIGHALGLRHGVRIDDSSGYSDQDADGVTNSLLFPTAVLQPNTGTGNTAPCRLNFFGPVQRNAVRARYSIP